MGKKENEEKTEQEVVAEQLREEAKRVNAEYGKD